MCVCAHSEVCVSHTYTCSVQPRGSLACSAHIYSIRHAYVSIRQHTSSIRRSRSQDTYIAYVKHTSAYVSIRQHTSSIRRALSTHIQHTSSIRQHTSLALAAHIYTGHMYSRYSSSNTAATTVAHEHIYTGHTYRRYYSSYIGAATTGAIRQVQQVQQ
jgi:hypothetical protein